MLLGAMATGPATLPAGLGSFEVNVKDFHGHSVVISVNPRWNVAAVKQRISENTGIPPADYKLVFAGTPLADSLTLMVGPARRQIRVSSCYKAVAAICIEARKLFCQLGGVSVHQSSGAV